MATYYVSPTGSNTAPYDTWAKAANHPHTAISAASANDIVLIGPGTYNTTGDRLQPTVSGLTISGALVGDSVPNSSARDLVIIGGFGSSSYHTLYTASGAANATIKNLSILPAYTSKSAIASAATGVTYENIKLYETTTDNIGYQIYFLNGATNFTFKNCVVYHSSRGGKVLYAEGNSSGTIQYSIFMPQGLPASFNNVIELLSSGDINIYNSVIFGSYTHGIYYHGSGTLTLRNNIIGGSSGLSTAYSLIRTTGTVDSDYNTYFYNPNVPTLSTSGVALGAHDSLGINPKFVNPGRSGFVSFEVDDSSSLAYAQGLKTILDEYGYVGVYSVNQATFNSSDTAAVVALQSSGWELACHSYSHNPLNATSVGTLVYSGSGANPVYKVDLTNHQFSVSTDGSIDAYTVELGVDNSKSFADSLAEIRSNTSNRWNVTYSTFAPNTMSGDVKMSSCASVDWTAISTAIALDLSGATGYYLDEIANPKAWMLSQFGVEVKSFTCPYNVTSNAVNDFFVSSGLYTNARNVGYYDGTAINLFRLNTVSTALIGATNDETRARTRSVLFNSIALGVPIAILSHKTSEISYDNWRVILDVVKEFGDIIYTGTRSSIADKLRVSPYSYSDLTGISTATFSIDDVNLNLRSSSPCINAGTPIAGLTTDYDGNPLPPNGSGFVPDIGAYDTYEYSQGSLIAKAVIPAGNTAAKISIISVDDAVESMLYIDNGYIKAFDGVNTASLDISALAAGEHVFTVRWDYSLGTMAVGMVGLGSVTWGSDATYRGFWETDLSEYIRCFYAGGNYPMYIKSIIMLSSRVLNDTELIYYTNN